MKIENLRTASFRNLTEFDFRPCPSVNVVFGDNAQGKTNLLEAIWLFTGAKSFRGTGDRDLIRVGENSSLLTLDFTARGAPERAVLSLSSKRAASVNNVPLESSSLLAGEFCCVIFSPDHLSLVKEGPQARRRFIDAAICPLWPKHIAAVRDYARALAQRNALLRDIPRHAELLDSLEIWDERLCYLGARIVRTRLRYLDALLPFARETYDKISKMKETLTLSYISCDDKPYPPGLSDLREIAGLLSEQLKKTRVSDLDAGWTHAGPHRDDLRVEINSLPARLYGSQGQQRSAVLALKLAEASELGAATGEPPVLLLDDVMSELDKTRQDYLLNSIGVSQVFITCCDPAAFSGLADGAVFEIKAGMAKKIR